MLPPRPFTVFLIVAAIALAGVYLLGLGMGLGPEDSLLGPVHGLGDPLQRLAADALGCRGGRQARHDVLDVRS
jgi:hypothetical protein